MLNSDKSLKDLNLNWIETNVFTIGQSSIIDRFRLSIGRQCYSLSNISANELGSIVWIGMIFRGAIFPMSSLGSVFDACPDTCLRPNIFGLSLFQNRS
jgi:hypothetical protein